MFGEKRKSTKIKLYLIATILFASVVFALTSCGKKNTTFVTSGTNNDSIVNNSENDVKSETGINSDDVNKQNGIEYDVYKKIDLTKFIKEDDNDAYIDYENGGLYLADGLCKVTVKANVKVERGPALTSDKINDGFAILFNVGISNFNIYYADYGNNFFDEFHEVERAREYNVGNAGNGKVKFNNIGIVSAYGIYNYKTKYVSHNREEFIGEFVTDKESQNIMKVIIKDVYYKISKPTGIATEWDLDKDFTSVTANKKQCFFMKELDIGYNYALAPKCTININDKYKKTNKDFILFYYITDNNDVSSCTNIRNERENNISPLYSKVGLGINWNEWRKDGKTVNVNAEWDKNNKTLIVKEKNGDIMGTIKFDYIKEYKYKKCIENDTAGYRRYLSATNKKQTNGKTTNNKAIASVQNNTQQGIQNINNQRGIVVSDDAKYSFEDPKYLYTIDIKPVLTYAKDIKLITDYPDETLVDDIEAVTFGSYPQSYASGKSSEPIEWIPIDRKDGKILLLCKYILDYDYYNSTHKKKLTWTGSDMRKWLNDDFYNKAFDGSEKNMIVTTHLSNDIGVYPNPGEPWENDTDDKVFFISVDDCVKYFNIESEEYDSDDDGVMDGIRYYNSVKLATGGTFYARHKVINGSKMYTSISSWDYGNSHFWLRSPCGRGNVQRVVHYDGTIVEYEDNRQYGIRPAIWVKYE